MQESHGKGPTSHPDPESCVDGRKAGGEALTGAHAGQPLSCEIRQCGVPTPLSEAEGHTELGATGKPISDPAQSKNPALHAAGHRGFSWLTLKPRSSRSYNAPESSPGRLSQRSP